MKTSSTFFISACILFAGCGNKEESTPSKTLTEVIAADNAGDLDKVIAYYTEDAILIPAGSSDIIGKNAIREHYRNIFTTSVLQLQASSNEIIDANDWTIIRGNTTGKVIFKADSSATAVNDKFIMVLKKDDGRWKIYRLMWSSHP
ncbi:MAG: hypothetical protein C4308_05635 [Chitinophagaceae bacterium]